MQASEGAASDFFEDDEEDFGLGGPAADLEGTGVSANDDAASIDLYGDIADGGRDHYASLYGSGNPSTQQTEEGVKQQTANTSGPAEIGEAEHASHSGAPKQQSSSDPGHAAKRTSAPESTRGEPTYGTVDSIYIGNLQWWTTDAQIEELCSKYGVPQKIRFFEDKASGKSKGYVLVTFDNVKAAYTCKQELDGTMVDGKKCVVTFAKQKEPGKGPPAQRDGSATASTSQGPSGRGTAFRGRGQEHAGRAARPRPMGEPPFPGGMGGGRGPRMGWSGGPAMGGPFMPPGMMGPGMGPCMGPGMGPMGPGMPFMPPGFPPGMQPGMHMGGGMQYGGGPMNTSKRPRY